MAASGVMSDFARMPTQRKVTVFVVIGLVIGLLYYQFLYKSLQENLVNAEQENAAKDAMNQKLGSDIPKFEELRSRLGELQQIIAENAKALPTEAEVPAFFETLERKVTESGVEIAKWNKKPEETIETFIKVPVEIEITGTFMQIKRFFASLVRKDVATTDGRVQERERIVSIENLNLTSPVVRNRELILTSKFTAVTFRQDDSGGAGQMGPAAPIVSPSAPSLQSTPPLPSPSSPAGAKARTEDSLKKGDAIDRKATGVDEAKTPAGGR